jgi:hypothetical protein
VALVDGHLHLDHLARRLFCFLVVFIKCALHMAELALHAQRITEELHAGLQLVSGSAF